MAFAPRRILVTGASGFVGQHLLLRLRRDFPGAELVAAERRALCPGADRSLPMDLERPEAMDALVRDAAPDAILHLAAQAAVGEAFAQPGRTWRLNLLGTLALADAALAHAPEAPFLFASSAEVYGLTFRDRAAPLDEDAPMCPANPYAASKAASDIALGEMALRGLRVLRMRPGNHAGAGQSEGFALPAFAAQIARIEAGLQPPVMRVGVLDRWRDFLDVDDVCAAYSLALREAERLPSGLALNIASGQPRRIGDILHALLERSSARITVEEDATRLRPTDVPRTVGDATRLREMLGWRPEIDWDRTLNAVLADWRERVRGPEARVG